MKILVDGDIIRYRCGFAAEHMYYDWWHKDDCEQDENGEWGTKTSAQNPIATCENAKDAKAWLEAVEEPLRERYVRLGRVKIEPLENAIRVINLVMDGIQAKYPKGQLVFYGSCPTPDNWRTQFYPEYKANRPDRAPFWANEITKYVARKYGAIVTPPYEADDLIAMAAYECEQRLEPCVVVTIDKDMDQIPGLHYNWVDENEYIVVHDMARWNLQVQAIMGDRTDNIVGIPGWGKRAAEEWLQGQGPVDAYLENGMWTNEYEALYQFALNKALVSLPVSHEDRALLEEDVRNAKQKFEAYNASSSLDGDSGENPRGDADVCPASGDGRDTGDGAEGPVEVC